MPTQDLDAPTVKDQAGTLMQQLAGYVGHRTIAIGLRNGLIETLAHEPDGISTDDLAAKHGFDAFYLAVWSRAAIGAGVLDRTDTGGVRLAPHMATLLLDKESPTYVGGVFIVLEQHELLTRLEQNLGTGDRLWWDGCSPEFIAAVSGTGTPFYRRLVPTGLAKVPGLAERLEQPARILDTSCGAGVGLVLLAQTYPNATIVGADGDAHSLELAAERIKAHGIDDRVSLVHSPLEDVTFEAEFDLVTNNISMHECRDLDKVTANVHRALKDGGWFVISDFPFPDTDAGLRTVPGRIMSGIQYFEAQIDDQLLPRATYDDLLGRHGFRELGWFEITPMHAVTYGVR